MAVNLSPLGGVAAQFFNNDGVPLAGGFIYTYAAGTNTPSAPYTTGAGTIAHSNPIVLDSAGRVPSGEIWLTDGLAYKFVIKDSSANLIGTYDNIVGINSNFVNYTASQEIQTATAGQTVFTLTTMVYQPGNNSLSVFVDGVNQYGPGAQYAFIETNSTTVTFASGLHVGASVKFTTAVINNVGGVDASQVTYDPPFPNSQVTTVEIKLSEYVSVLDFGAVGDSNLTPGNGTDNTTAFQNAVDYCASNGKILFIPVGNYRITAPIDFTGDTNKFGFEGESNLQTVIYADFTSVTKRAALSVNNPSGNRAYVAFKNFRLQGKLDPLTIGIYCNWTGSFSQIENVFVNQFYDGIVVSNDYYIKIVNCFSIGNLNNGLQFGYEIDGSTAGPCNNNLVLGGLFNANGANGISFSSCRAMALVQCSAEANEYTNIYLDYVYGGNITGVYMEYSDALTPSYNAQLKIKNSNGISINGLSVSAFKSNANPVIDLDGNNNGIVINGVAIELGFSGTKYTAIGIRVYDSFSVTIDGCVIDGCSVGIYVPTIGRCTINNVNFSNYTNPLLVSDNANCRVQWKNTSPTWVAASNIGALAKVDLEYIDNTKNVIDGTNVFRQTVSYSDLASGGTKKIIDSVLPGESWRIIDIIVVGVTAANAGGDRGLALTDGTSVYTIVPAATLKTLNFQGRWGSAAVPFSAVYYAMVQPTVAGTDLVAAWSGGTTDYTDGLFIVQVTAERIA